MEKKKEIPVGVSGAKGHMGRITAAGLEDCKSTELVFKTDLHDDLEQAIRETGARVVVDFTTPEAVFENTLSIIAAGASPVVGTTGLSDAELLKIDEELSRKKLGGIVCPNFSLGALLMMKLSTEAARHMDRCEIIELHHDRKKDSPSGTSLLTAKKLNSVFSKAKRESVPFACERHDSADEGRAQPSRGMADDRVRVHSIRLPGLMAHQQVVFGSEGETLTISHNAVSRDCFLPGILMAVHEVLELKRLQIGIKI